MKTLMRSILSPLVFLLIGGAPLFAETAEDKFNQAELDQMLAPIALYPDVLLSQVLMAATYPLEVVEASRWSRDNAQLEGDSAVEAVEGKDWDESVKALVGFPELIQLMDEHLDWTRQLGDAFLAQEEAVMESVQQLRQKAFEEGTLASMDNVTIEQQGQEIIIEPANVEVVYVPYYSTRVVYGDWWWHDYPPVYWDIGLDYYGSYGLGWSRGFRVSTSFYYSTCYWPRRRVVVIDRHRDWDRHDFKRLGSYRRYDRYANDWRHNPIHRRGVRYNNDSLHDRYGRSRSSGSIRSRMDYPNRDQRPSVRERPNVATWQRPDARPQRPDLRQDRSANSGNRSETRTNRQITRPDQSGIRSNRTPRENRPSVATNRTRPNPTVTRPNSTVTRPSAPTRTPPPQVQTRTTNTERSNDTAYASNPRYTEGNRRATEIRRDRLSNQSNRRSPIRTRDP